MLKLAIDLDGTICQNKIAGLKYSDADPVPGAVETLNYLKSKGCYIVIYTARNMGTYQNNIGKITANQAPIILEWLKRHNIPYDELILGKPNVDYFIDDKGLTFTTWKDIQNKLQKELEDV